MQQPQEITFKSTDGHTTVYASIWLPEGEPQAVVQICHGMAEHIGRYDRFARELCAQGFAVCGDDHLGHGRTAAAKEDLGYFGEKDGWLHLVEDEHTMRSEMQKRFPGLPYFLLGHSMGSFITRNYVTKHGKGLAGYICCGTSGPVPMSRLAVPLAGAVAALRGGRRTGKFLNKLAFKDYNSRYDEVKTGLEWLSRDQEVYQPFANDPKANFVFTNAGFRDLFRLLGSVTGEQWSRRLPKGLPMIFLSGDMDPVGQFGEGVKKVVGWVKAAGVEDVQLKLYPGARHELHNETNREEFLADVTGWMKAHMA